MSLKDGILSTFVEVSTPNTALNVMFIERGKPLGVGTVNEPSIRGV